MRYAVIQVAVDRPRDTAAIDVADKVRDFASAFGEATILYEGGEPSTVQESTEYRIFDAGAASEVIEEHDNKAQARERFEMFRRENPTGLFELHARPVGAWEVSR